MRQIFLAVFLIAFTQLSLGEPRVVGAVRE